MKVRNTMVLMTVSRFPIRSRIPLTGSIRMGPFHHSARAMSTSGRVSTAVQDFAADKSTDKKLKRVKLDTNPPRGTRDFYPPDMRMRNWLFEKWRSVASSFGFSEYDAPVLESEELYTRKAGEEVTQQLYNFVDKGERAVALRPEMTPSLARMVMAKKGGLTLPLKWFSIPQCWRYERMTRGRRREHFQWNMDIWGVPGEEADAELLGAMVVFFKSVGLTSDDVGIKVNSRLVIGEVLSELGIPPEKFAATCVLVDKLEKVPLDAIQDDLADLGLDRSVVEKLTKVLSVKSFDAIQDMLGEESPAVQQIVKLTALCEAYEIADWIVFDASVVRGLSYYTGAVFEAFDRKGDLRAIAGGGRYDNLLETFGGEPTPAAGFGFGDAVIVELLKDRGLLPSFDATGTDTVVFAQSMDLYPVALKVANSLREAGQSVDFVLEQKKAKWVFKHADRIGARFCVVVGSQEYANGEVAIKDLRLGEQESVKIAGLADWDRQTSIMSSAKELQSARPKGSSVANATTGPRRYLIGGNWKSNGGYDENAERIKVFNEAGPIPDNVDVVLCVPYLHIGMALSLLRDDIEVGGQDCGSNEKDGAYTGEVGAHMLKDIGCTWVIVGHSERREGFGMAGEPEELCAEKCKVALGKGLKVMFAIGEKKEERESGVTMDVCAKQLAPLAKALEPKDWENVAIAYEPVWAIGTGLTATPELAQETHANIRQWVKENVSEEVAAAVRIQYGGSMKGANAESLLQQPDIDGGLIGGASLKADFFNVINGVPK